MKNRRQKKSYKVQDQIPFPVFLAYILVSIAVFGLSYIWLCARCELLGQQIKMLETNQRQTQRRLINEQDRWANQLAPANFERILKRHHLMMTMPNERQVVRVPRRDTEKKSITLAYNK